MDGEAQHFQETKKPVQNGFLEMRRERGNEELIMREAGLAYLPLTEGACSVPVCTNSTEKRGVMGPME